MDYKEKYEKALATARKLYNEAKANEYTADMEDYETIFPELAESEDEKIRKALIEYFNAYPKDYYGELKKSHILAWLEKQGEKKPIDKVEPKFNVGDKIQYLKGCGTIMTIEKIENGEYIFGNNLGHITIEDGNKWYLVEQKPAWSEEDEYLLGTHNNCDKYYVTWEE